MYFLENIIHNRNKKEWKVLTDIIIEEYNINAVKVTVDDHEIEVWCYDDDLAQLFTDFSIGIGKTTELNKVFNFDDDYQPVGLDYNDYIETVELHQKGNTYLCRAYCAHNGVGADYAFALFDIEKCLEKFQ